VVETIISDLGNVLVRFDNGIFFRKAAAVSPLSVEEIEAAVRHHIDLPRDFECGRVSPREFFLRAEGILRTGLDQAAFFRIYNDIFQARPREIRLLRRLRGRRRLILLSNTDSMRYGFIRSRFPETRFFDAYVLSYEAGRTKPDRRIFEIALETAAAPPRACLFIDDLEDNTRVASELGMSVIHLPLEADLETELRRFDLAD